MGAKLHIANLVSSLLPQTRCFALRRRIYRHAGIALAGSSRINGGVVFQNANVSIGQDSWVGRRTEFVSTSNAHISIGSNCDISQDVLFVVGSHEIGESDRRAGKGKSRPISVGDGTWVGARATFLGGSSVGKGVVVGAGSTVIGDYPDNVLLVGTPARIIRYL
ncbi:acyltransferase [Frigoribacterium sp. CFBP9029]|uniref:acyltransferase n=1 Tax=Frigoribacterium sp. CFBP9029 TaxID=3096541 RepID=UPI0039C87FFF